MENKKGLRIIIAGGRTFSDYEKLKKNCLKIITEKIKAMGQSKIDRNLVTIISGCAPGADTLGERFSKEFGLQLEKYPANWDRDGRKRAGPMRNQRMADAAVIDKDNFEPMLIAFWDGESRGTKNMIETAKRKHIETYIVQC